VTLPAANPIAVRAALALPVGVAGIDQQPLRLRIDHFLEQRSTLYIG
jgi:hypothetical protein